jgi:hypothetical protein
LDFTIELVASDGATVTAPASRFAQIAPPLTQTLTKLDYIERDTYTRDWDPFFKRSARRRRRSRSPADRISFRRTWPPCD